MKNLVMAKTLSVLCAAVLVCSLTLAGCSSQPKTEEATGNTPAADTVAATPTSVTFTDDTGTSVTIENPQRVVACMGSFANAWEEAGGTLVGASDDAFASYDITSPDVAKVGDFSTPSLESIIALNPDFVILTSGTGGRGGASSQTDMKEALEASGITVAFFNVTVFEDYLRMFKTFTDITGRSDLYAEKGEKQATDIDALKAEISSQSAPRVLLMTTYSGGTRVQNSATQTGAMLADLGAANVADENPSLLKDFSLETVIETNPDFILVVPMGNDDAAAMQSLEAETAANPAWGELSAVSDGHYKTLDKALYLYKPNSRWSEAYQGLYDILYAA